MRNENGRDSRLLSRFAGRQKTVDAAETKERYGVKVSNLPCSKSGLPRYCPGKRQPRIELWQYGELFLLYGLRPAQLLLRV